MREQVSAMKVGVTKFSKSAMTVALAFVMLSSAAAYAWSAFDRFVPSTGPSSAGLLVGDIQQNGDGPFRFQLSGAPALCTTGAGSTTWGEIAMNLAPGNSEMPVTAEAAKVMISTITAAKLAGRPVWLATFNSTGTNAVGHGCRVTVVTMK